MGLSPPKATVVPVVEVIGTMENFLLTQINHRITMEATILFNLMQLKL